MRRSPARSEATSNVNNVFCTCHLILTRKCSSLRPSQSKTEEEKLCEVLVKQLEDRLGKIDEILENLQEEEWEEEEEEGGLIDEILRKGEVEGDGGEVGGVRRGGACCHDVTGVWSGSARLGLARHGAQASQILGSGVCPRATHPS